MPRSKTSKANSKKPAKRRPKPKAAPRTYTDEFKLLVLHGLRANGNNLTATSRMFDVPRATIIEWIQKAVSESKTSGQAGSSGPLPPLNPDYAKSLAQTMEDYAKTLTSIDPRMLHLYAISVKDVGVALGIIAERVILLRGGTTDRRVVDVNVRAGLVITGSRLRADQANAIGRVVDELCNDQLVVYNPAPGDPDYDPGIDIPNAYPAAAPRAVPFTPGGREEPQ